MRTYTGISCNNRLQTMDFTPPRQRKTKIPHNVILHIDTETSGSADRLGDDFPKLQQRKFRIQP